MMRRINYKCRATRVLGACLLLGGLAVPRSATAQATQRKVINVLFVGNSQMATNNLPDVTAGIAAADPIGPIILGTLTNESDASALLKSGTKWDYMVYQALALFVGNTEPGPPAIWPQPEREFVMGDPEGFKKTTRELVGAARAAGAKSILFPSPPRRLARFDADVPEVWQKILDAHYQVARELNVDVAPIQAGFEQMRQRLIAEDMFMYDGSHPSELGTYTEALIIYAMITGRDPAGAPPIVYGRPMTYVPGPNLVNDNLRVALVDIPLTRAMEAQRVAWEVVKNRAKAGSN